MKKYVVVDIETTGTQPLKSDIIELGAVYVEGGKVTKTFDQLVDTDQEISPYITSITHIDKGMLKGAPTIEEVLPAFLDFCGDAPLVGHNLIVFDYRMLKVKATRYGYPFEKEAVDTLVIARQCLQDLPSRKLQALCDYYHIDLVNAHRAFDDAYATYQLFEALKKEFYKDNPALFQPQTMNWEPPKYVPITPRQKKYLLGLSQMHHLDLEKDINNYTKSEASKAIDDMIRTYGR